MPFNAFGTIGNEPFLPDTAWLYVLKAFKWARKYGIRINLDLHTMPGSQVRQLPQLHGQHLKRETAERSEPFRCVTCLLFATSI